MKIRSVLVLIILISVSLISAQARKNWKVIDKNDEATLYIDANNIKELDNQISIWSLETFINDKVAEDGTLISKIKTQFLINKLTGKYSEIGSIKYDETGRIIHDFDKQTKSTLASNVSLSSNPKVMKLYNLADRFLKTGQLAEYRSVDKPKTEEKTKEKIVENEKSAADTLKVVEKVDPNLIVIKGTKKPEKAVTAPILEIAIMENEPLEIAPAKPVEDEIEEIEEIKSAEYDINKDVAVEGTIFSDGNLYCIQISSWRNKSTADRQAEKFRKMGYNSFVTEVYISSKRSTWYRVRVGYFNTLKEAREVRAKLN